MRSNALLLAICLTLLAAAVAAEEEKRPLDFEVLRSVRNVGPPVISPDGAQVAWSLTETTADGRRTNLWLAAASGTGEPTRLTTGAARDSSPRWSPAGARLAFLSDRSESQQVWLLDVAGGEPRRLTSLPAGAASFRWGPSGRRIAVVTAETTADGERTGSQTVHLVDVASGEGQRLQAATGLALAVDWAPDGRALAFSRQLEPGFYGAQETDLFLLDLESGASRPLVQRPGIDQAPEFSPDGRAIAFVSGFGRKGLLPNLGVALVSPESGEVRDLGRTYDRGGFFEGPSRLEWSPDGRWVFSNANHGTGERLARLDVQSGETVLFTTSELSWGGLDVAAGAQSMALLGTDFEMPWEVFVTPLERFEPRRISRSNPQLADVALPQGEIVRWRAPDGEEIAGLLVLPPGYESGRLPLLVSLHGGPATSVGMGFPGISFFYNPYRDELLASHGYAVLLPNPRGSGGFGEAFRRAAVGDWGEGPLGDVLAGVDHLVARGIADQDRVGVMGWSYGGYLSAWAITATDRFRAASVGAGIFDLASHYGQAREQMLEYFGGPPWEETASYRRSSPSAHAAGITTPTQVIHGRADTAVSPAQAEYLVAALRTLEVPHEVHYYPDEGHSLRDRGVQEESWRSVLEWFDRWLRTDDRDGATSP